MEKRVFPTAQLRTNNLGLRTNSAYLNVVLDAGCWIHECHFFMVDKDYLDW
jgi:hypothetical protein